MDLELQLIKNLETQLNRLIAELDDLEETKDEVEELEYNELKAEFRDQTIAVSEAIERMNRGDVSVTSQYTIMKKRLRNAIANSFNTMDVIKIFGCKLENDFEKQLNVLKEDFKLKRIGKQEMEAKRMQILEQIQLQNAKLLSAEDLEFLRQKSQQEMLQLCAIDD